MAVSLRGVAAVHGKTVRENVSTYGSRLLMHVNIAMVIAAVLAMLSISGYQKTSWACDSRPVILKSWFQTMYTLQFWSVVLFCLIHCGLTSLMGELLTGRRAVRARERQADAIPSADEEQPPGPTPAPDPAPAPQPEAEADFCCLYNVLSSTMLLFVITGMKFLWCVLGIYTAADASGRDDCDSSAGLAWLMAWIGIFQICCCQIFPMADAHTPREQEATTEV